MKQLSSKIFRDLFKSTIPKSVASSYQAQQSVLPELYDEHSEIKDFSEVPGPKPLPIIGNIWRYLPVIGEYDSYRRHLNYENMYKTYGSIVKEVVIGQRVLIHLFDPNDMETMYRSEGRYPTRISHRALLKYRLERPDVYNDGGLFPSNGEEWHRLRHAFQKTLLHSQIVNEYVSSLNDISEDVIKKIKGLRSDQREFENFQEDLYKWAIECTGLITLNRRLGCIGKGSSSQEVVDQLVKAAGDTHEAVMITENGLPLWNIFPTAAYRSLVAAQDFMAGVVEKYLNTTNEQLNVIKGETMLDRFQAITNADKKDIFAMILDMFLAGIDTVAYSAAFTLYHLARNQKCQENLYQELKNLIPNETTEMTPRLLNSLHYLKACVKESMRLSPIAVGTGRVLPKDLIISNYKIPAQTMIIAHHQVSCRQAQYFPDPLAFRPERWLADDHSQKIHPFLVLPFGFGPRMCIGRRFAEAELYLLLSKILRNFSVEYNYGDMDCYTRLINVPDQPLRFKFIDRS